MSLSEFKRYFLFFFISTAGVNAQPGTDIGLVSPDGHAAFTFSIKANGALYYAIKYKNQQVIFPSRLGLLHNPNGYDGAPDWNKNFILLDSQRKSKDTTWIPLYGEKNKIRDHYNELTITIQDTVKRNGRDQAPIALIARAYNEGVAFRYFFPESSRTQLVEIGAEDTHFRFPAEATYFVTDHAQGKYAEKSIVDIKKNIELPLTVKIADQLWASVLHAEQTDFPRLRLGAENGELVSRLYGEIVGTSPFGTPWRVVMLAEKPGQLLENNYLILNLNPPNKIKDVSWIRPGKVMREITLATKAALELVDFAVEQNLDFIHFDAGWYGHEYDQKADASEVNIDPKRNPVNDLDLKEIIKYGKKKGIGVILYVNHRALENQIDSIFPLYQKWGVAGVKFGFVHTGSHRWTAWMHEAVVKAAKYHLMVDIHDEYMPTGFSRTYPNLMTQEGVSGNEEFPDATHNTVLPFTRFLAGAADYTYCFNEQSGRLKNSKGHQLALSIINYSPWQYLFWYGTPEHYQNREEIALWKTMPTVWDDTQVLSGSPGEQVVVARQNEKEWYIGVITNNDARKMKVNMNFLKSGSKYQAQIYEDDGKGGVVKTERVISSKDILDFTLIARGGVAIRLISK